MKKLTYKHQQIGQAKLFYWTVVLSLFTTTQSALAELNEGFVEPYENVRVAAAESGLLKELLVREGAEVAQGQILGSLDCEVLLAERRLAEAKATSTARRDASEAELKLRKTRMGKLEKLRATGDANAEEVERARADVEVAEANFAATVEEREIAALDLRRLDALIERRKIRSPINGVVVKVERKQGEFVTLTEPQVITVVNTQQLLIRFHVPQSTAARLKVGEQQTVTFFDTQATVSGKIEFVSPLTEVESNTVRVHVQFENPQGKIRCGTRCSLGESSGKFSARPKNIPQ